MVKENGQLKKLKQNKRKEIHNTNLTLDFSFNLHLVLLMVNTL